MLPPSPSTKRATNVTAPNAMSSRSTQLKGVRSVPPADLEFDVAVAFGIRDLLRRRLRKKAYAAPSKAPTPITAGGTAPSAVLVKAGNGFSP